MSFGVRDFTSGPFKKKKGQFFERFNMAEKQFDIGDIVQFNNIYKWCDGAAEGVDFRVVDDNEVKKWGNLTGQEVNGYTREITVSCVNQYPQDFMLMAKAEKEPVVVNVTINNDGSQSESEFGKALADHVRERVFQSVRDAYRPSGSLFAGAGRGFELPGNAMITDEVVSRAKIDARVHENTSRISSAVSGPIKSDGGSSSYYDLPIPNELMNKLFDRWEEGDNSYIKTEEMIRYFFKNDFDFGTALKSLVRAFGTTQGGGKAGNDVVYETNKVQYYAKKIGEIHGKKDS